MWERHLESVDQGRRRAATTDDVLTVMHRTRPTLDPETIADFERT
ncbi:MAG: hypothetical protein WBQ50_16455 [Nocardioides sp.]